MSEVSIFLFITNIKLCLGLQPFTDAMQGKAQVNVKGKWL